MTSLMGYVPPAMSRSPWNGNTGTDRGVEHLIFDEDPISTGQHHEMFLLIAVNVHWRATPRRCHGFNDRIGTIGICAGKPYCDTFTRRPFIPRALIGCIF